MHLQKRINFITDQRLWVDVPVKCTICDESGNEVAKPEKAEISISSTINELLAITNGMASIAKEAVEALESNKSYHKRLVTQIRLGERFNAVMEDYRGS